MAHLPHGRIGSRGCIRVSEDESVGFVGREGAGWREGGRVREWEDVDVGFVGSVGGWNGVAEGDGRLAFRIEEGKGDGGVEVVEDLDRLDEGRAEGMNQGRTVGYH